MAPVRGAALVATLILLVGRADAEVYKVTKEDAGAWTFAAKHLFYVDATPARGNRGRGGSGLAREENEAQVLFEDFRVTSRKLGSKEDASSSLQVGLIPWGAFDELVDRASFCDAHGNLSLRDRPRAKYARIMTVPFGKTVTEQMKIPKTGVYMAFLANCGATDDLQLSGTISVKGSNGFLPANRQGALTLAGWCLALSVIVGMAWVAVLASNKKDLHEPHYVIASFIAFCAGEAACNWQYLSEMSETGESSVWLEKLCQGLSIMKTAYLFAVVMLLCFGVGLTQPEEHSNKSWKLLAVTTLFSAALAPKVCVFEYRHAKNLPDNDIILAMVPGVLITLGSIVWGAKGIRKTMTRCKDLNYDGTLKLLQRLVVLVVMLLIAVAGVLAAQVLDKPGKGALWWQYHLFWSDAAGQMVHLIFLVCLMIVCRPSRDNFRADTYTASQGDGEMKGVPCAQEDDDPLDIDDPEDGPRAETIGASASSRAAE